MLGSGGFSLPRTQGGDQFYNPQMRHRCHPHHSHHHHQQQLLIQQQQQQQLLLLQIQQYQQLQRPLMIENRAGAADVENRADSDDWPSTCLASVPRQTPLTNIERLVEVVTPFVIARRFFEPRRGLYFSLTDLWESFREWSMYGVGVPMLLNGKNWIQQFYVPSLSGIQLYIDSRRSRRPGEVSQTSQEEAEPSNAPGQLVFEYLEHEAPHARQPLFDKVSDLASQSPQLRMWSCDLSASSWISVAWYPIYRIPTGLENVDASFLTFHSLSSHSKGNGRLRVHTSDLNGMTEVSPKILLPVFGLAYYKRKGSILLGGVHERQLANFLLQAANEWVRQLKVHHPDFEFFLSQNTHFR